MTTLQDMIASLPFVTGAPGNLDLWNPTVTGDVARDLNMGRWSAAVLLHTMRVHDFPGLFHHCAEAWCAKGDPVCSVMQGVKLEIGDTILHAPAHHSELARAAHLNFPARDIKAALEALPFARMDETGRVLLNRFNLGGDRSQRVETGKYYGAAICRLIKATGWTNFLAEGPSGAVKPGMVDVLLGIRQVLAEVCMSASPHCTVHQRAASHFFEEGGPVQPAVPPSVVNAI